jgi:acyl-CoA synthetase (NDP forming)
MIVEHFRAPARFLAAARAARRAGKPIVLLHPGKSSAARRSAATHTGAMAGDYSLMRAKVEREGVIFAETLQELADIAEILLRCPPQAAASRRAGRKRRVQGADAGSGRGTGPAAGPAA